MSENVGRFKALRKLMFYRPQWDVMNLQGSDECLHWNTRDLIMLDKAIMLCKRTEVAVQAGSNLGLFPKRLAETFEEVYTFEPDEKLSEYARLNAPEYNIFHFQAALGNSNEPVSLGYGRRGDTDRRVHEGLTHVNGSGDIPQMMLDDLKLTACDLIYLDIEGYELFALRGAERTIDRHRPVIGVEINSRLKNYGLKSDDVRDWFKERNYARVFRLHKDEVYVPCSP